MDKYNRENGILKAGIETYKKEKEMHSGLFPVKRGIRKGRDT